jgi:hypothetical protein
MPTGRLTGRERVGRSLGLARRGVRAGIQRLRRSAGGGEVGAETFGDVVREGAGRIRRALGRRG